MLNADEARNLSEIAQLKEQEEVEKAIREAAMKGKYSTYYEVEGSFMPTTREALTEAGYQWRQLYGHTYMISW